MGLAEQAARAAHRTRMEHKHQRPGVHPWEALSPLDQRLRILEMEAALQELAEPSDRVLSDGAFQIFKGERITQDDLDAAKRVWRAMIRSVLAGM